jgi:hypothetical protein
MNVLQWDKFLKGTVATIVALLAALYLFVFGLNPYGNLQVSAVPNHVIMDGNQRFQYPSVIRSGRYDSIVIGTSTSRLLDPVLLDKHLGGRFANLAMNSAMAWEQYRVAGLYLRKTGKPGTLLVGLDHVWCRDNADTVRITKRGFPEWMYDDNPWNDLPYFLNMKAVVIAVRQVAYYLGIKEERLDPNGFRVFTPPDDSYDSAKAQLKIWGGPPRKIMPVTPPFVPNASDISAWRYPALAWLEEIVVQISKSARVLLVFMPPHVSSLALPGSGEAARFAECKRQLAGIATRHGAHLIDFRISSQITIKDEHYWDSGHYRLPIGGRIIRGIAQAVETRRDDPAGDWHYLAGPGKDH